MLSRLIAIGIFFLSVINTPPLFGQPSRIQHQDRLGDSLQLVDIMPDPERLPLENDFKGAWTVGANWQSNGWGLQLHMDIHNKNKPLERAYKNKIFDALQIYYHLGEQKHPKEIDYYSVQVNNKNTFRLGKINRFYFQQLGVAFKKGLGVQLDESSIGISWITGLHVNIGLLKPYYLDISGLGEVKYDEEHENDFLNPGAIVGKGAYFKGFNELKIKFGLGLKTGLFFDFAKKEKRISGLYVFSGIDYYFDEVLIFYDDPHAFYFNIGLGIHFGKYF